MFEIIFNIMKRIFFRRKKRKENFIFLGSKQNLVFELSCHQSNWTQETAQASRNAALIYKILIMSGGGHGTAWRDSVTSASAKGGRSVSVLWEEKTSIPITPCVEL